MTTTVTFHAPDATLLRAGSFQDPVSIDVHAAPEDGAEPPCGLCCGAGAVREEHEPGEGVELVPAWGYESGQRPCPACRGEGEVRL